MVSLLPLPVGLCLAAAPSLQEDWPCFGGPARTNEAPRLEARPDWGDKGPDVLWRTATGPGFGGAAVHGGEVFLLDCELGEADVLRAFDLASGAEKWSAAYEARGRVQFPGSRCVPAVTEDAVYTAGPFGHATCFDRTTHEVRWEEHLEETYGGEQPMFGWSASPLLVGNVVVFTALGSEVGLVALDRRTGEERWVTESVGYSHSTPALLELHGREQILFLSTSYQTSGQDAAAPTTISSFDPGSGELIWRHELTLSRLPVAPPVRIDGERIFLTGGYRSGSTLLRVTLADGEYSFREEFHIERGSQVHPPLLHDGHLYLLVNENFNEPRNRRAEGGLLCLALDGQERWRTGDNPYFGRGNALLAGDRLLIQDGFDGTLRVVRASPEGYRLEAEAKLFAQGGARDGQMWAPMALAGRRLLMRSQEELLCVQL